MLLISQWAGVLANHTDSRHHGQPGNSRAWNPNESRPENDRAMRKKAAFAVLFALLALAPSGFAQLVLTPVPQQQFFGPNGQPLSGGCLFTYAAGTTTPQATYTNSAGTIQNGNPIILNGGGFAAYEIWLNQAQSYKFVLFSAGGVNCTNGTQQWSADNVTPAVIATQTNTFTAPQTFSGAVTSTNVAAGTVANKNFPGDGVQYVSTSGSDSNDGLSAGTAKSTLAGAISTLTTGGTIYVGAGTFTMSSGVTVPVPIRIQCAVGGTPSRGGYGTVFKYTATIGVAITFSMNPGDQTGAGIYDCAFIGPGSTTSTTAIQLGSATGHAVSVTVARVHIGDNTNGLSDGFGTGYALYSSNGYINTILDPNCEYVGTCLVAYGEGTRVFGGDMANSTTSIVANGGSDVYAFGTSFDSDTGVYVNNNAGQFYCYGCHFENNSAALTSAGFIETQGSGNTAIYGGTFLDDSTSGTLTAFFTFGGSGTPHLLISGPLISSNGQTLTNVINPGSLTPAVTIAPPLYQTGTATAPIYPLSVSGTGACATITSISGVWAGTFSCTGTSGSSTATITLTQARNGWSCIASDQTQATSLPQSGQTGTTCTIKGSVNANDVIVFTATPY
jgi:hypothetical protein